MHLITKVKILSSFPLPLLTLKNFKLDYIFKQNERLIQSLHLKVSDNRK